jgi:L-methionine (R)-S-oxide reductase
LPGAEHRETGASYNLNHSRRNKMSQADTVLTKLYDMFSFIESNASLDENFRELAAVAAKVLDAENCMITLLSEGEVEVLGLQPGAKFGNVPAKARLELAATSGDLTDATKPLLTQSIKTGLVPNAMRSNICGKNKMFSAIGLNGKIIGVINTNQPEHKPYYSLEDLKLLDIVALFIGKTIQLIQLQNILNSRFSQIALAQATEKTVGDVLVSSVQNPTQLARIVAKSFYREMTKAGFGCNQIINAASEIISELSKSLRKHTKGLKGPVANPERG